VEIMNVLTQEIQTHWTVIRPLFAIRNEHDYDLAIEHLNELLDEVGTNEHHPLYELLDALGAVIHAYEEQHEPIPACTGREMVQFFLDEHELIPSELSELGSERTVQEIIDGKRELTVPQIRALAERFHISPAVFI